MHIFGRLSQEQIVFALAVLLCVGFAISLPGFLTTNNLLNLVRSVAILGILGVAMGLVGIGRGIDRAHGVAAGVWNIPSRYQRSGASAGFQAGAGCGLQSYRHIDQLYGWGQ